MKTFPGSFPPGVFNAMSLAEWGEVWALTVDFVDAEAEAARRAMERR